MRFLTIVTLSLLSHAASAQFTEGDGEGQSQLKTFSRTWTPTFYSLASVETDKFNDKGGRLSTYNYFSFHTFLTGGNRFSLRLPFTYGTAGTDRFNGERNNPNELQMQDIILEIRNPEFTYLPWDMGLFWAFRGYTPNSKSSKRSGQVARFRNHFIVSKVFSRWFEVDMEQRYYYSWQSRATYKNSFTDEYGFEVNDVATQTKQHEIEHWLALWGKVTPKVGFGVSAIFEDTFYHKSDAENKRKPPQRLLTIGPQARFPLNNNASFIFVYGDKVNREENLDELGQFLAKNTEFVLHSFISF